MGGFATNTWRGRLRAAPLVAAAVLVAGCSLGGDDEGAAAGDLPQLVLHAADLPAAFTAFDAGRQTATEAGDPGRFGRLGGWKARYRRAGTPTTPGPLVIDSRADAFGSADGAERNLDAMRARLGDVLTGAEPAAAPQLGDEAFAATTLEEGADRGVRFYFVAWRDENVTASLLVSGFEGRLTLADVVALARKQATRIEAAVD